MTNQPSNLPGLPIIGSIEDDGAGGYTLHLRAALPCPDPQHAGVLHVVQVAHKLPDGTALFDTLDFHHLYEPVQAFVEFAGGVEHHLDGPKKGLRKRLRDLLLAFEDHLDAAEDLVFGDDDNDIDDLEAALDLARQERPGAGLSGLMAAIFGRKPSSQIDEDIQGGATVLRDMFGGPVGGLMASGFAKWRTEMAGEDGQLDADKVLAGFPEGSLRESMLAKLNVGITHGFIKPYKGYDGPLPATSGAEPTSDGGLEAALLRTMEAAGARGTADGATADAARDQAAGGRASRPTKPGRVDPERTVVVGVTRKQAEDYGMRNVFTDIAQMVFPGKAVGIDMTLTVSQAEAMFSDAQTQGFIGTGPRRRMFQTAGERLRSVLNNIDA